MHTGPAQLGVTGSQTIPQYSGSTHTQLSRRLSRSGPLCTCSVYFSAALSVPLRSAAPLCTSPLLCPSRSGPLLRCVPLRCPVRPAQGLARLYPLLPVTFARVFTVLGGSGSGAAAGALGCRSVAGRASMRARPILRRAAEARGSWMCQRIIERWKCAALAVGGPMLDVGLCVDGGGGGAGR